MLPLHSLTHTPHMHAVDRWVPMELCVLSALNNHYPVRCDIITQIKHNLVNRFSASRMSFTRNECMGLRF